jgi:hypothetical protein
MIDRNGAVSAPATRACTGPLASHIGGFTALLSRRGYAPNTVQAKCMLVADLSRWLEVRGLSLDRLDQARLRQFHQDHRDRKRRGDVATGEQLLGYLRDLGCIQAPPLEVDSSPVGELIGEFARFLSSERGLSPATLINYLPIIRRFLDKQVAGGVLHLCADIGRRRSRSGARKVFGVRRRGSDAGKPATPRIPTRSSKPLTPLGQPLGGSAPLTSGRLIAGPRGIS